MPLGRAVVALLLLLLALPVPADPPARAGRISLLEGDVRLQPEPEADWRTAAINWPLTAGSRLESGRFSRAEVRIGSLVIRLGAESELTVNRLDEDRVALDVASGSVDLRVRSRELAEELEVTTPQAQVVFGEAGHYRIDVTPLRGSTAVSSRAGVAYVYGEQAALAVPGGRRGEIFADRSDYLLDDPRYDDFDAWVLAEEQRYADDAAGRYVSPEMTGYETLDRYGRWSDTAEYGAVWYPSGLPAGWAPYRFGEWVWFSAWGWTWIDHAPWGFAPSHYGRWVVLGGRWCWVPGQFVTRPVFAPAVVRWKGIDRHRRHVLPSRGSWAPLGPREKFVPPYRASERHVQEVNRPHHRSGFDAGGERRKFVLPSDPQPLAPAPGGAAGGGAVVTPTPSVAPLPGSVAVPLVVPRRGERAGVPAVPSRQLAPLREEERRGRRERGAGEDGRAGPGDRLRERAVPGGVPMVRQVAPPVGASPRTVLPGAAGPGVAPMAPAPGRTEADRGGRRADGAPGSRDDMRREWRRERRGDGDGDSGRRRLRPERSPERAVVVRPPPAAAPSVAAPPVVVPQAASPPPAEGRRKWLQRGGSGDEAKRPAGRGGRTVEGR